MSTRRSLCSLRHTNATLALMRNEVDIHTLSKQLGNSVRMIERCYSELTATMAAERLAWGGRGLASAELLE